MLAKSCAFKLSAVIGDPAVSNKYRISTRSPITVFPLIEAPGLY